MTGVKFRFLHEKKHFISAATFPQYTFNQNKGFLLPVFFEKTFGQFLTGVGVGYFWGLNHNNHSELGLLIGYQPISELDLMAEYFTLQNYYDVRGSNGYVNFGFRYEISDRFVFMGSFGTQVNTPTGIDRERFISWVGLRSLF